MRKSLAVTVFLGLSLFLSGCSSSGEKKEEGAGGPPPVYKINFDTSRGQFVVEVHTDWAPYGSARAYELVKKGFYDGDRFFRVVRGFVVQFGINGDPAINRDWMGATIPDDTRLQHNVRGRWSSPSRKWRIRGRRNSSSIYATTASLLTGKDFSPIGTVISGMEVVDDIYGGYGDMPPNGRPGPHADSIGGECLPDQAVSALGPHKDGHDREMI